MHTWCSREEHGAWPEGHPAPGTRLSQSAPGSLSHEPFPSPYSMELNQRGPPGPPLLLQVAQLHFHGQNAPLGACEALPPQPESRVYHVHLQYVSKVTACQGTAIFLASPCHCIACSPHWGPK